MTDEIPQWSRIGDGRYETVDAMGRRWQFWPVDDRTAPNGIGYRLAPYDDLEQVSNVNNLGGLHRALKVAGLLIQTFVLRADAEALLLQLGGSLDDIGPIDP